MSIALGAQPASAKRAARRRSRMFKPASREGEARGAKPGILAAKKMKTSLERRFAMIHPRFAINKRKEVIRCLMVQQRGRFCSFGRSKHEPDRLRRKRFALPPKA
jgi:hypothetical protein